MTTRFSRQTVIAAIDLFGNDRRTTHGSFTAFLIEQGAAVYEEVRDEPIAFEKRLNDLKQFLDRNPAHPVDGGLLADVIVEKAVTCLPVERPCRPWDKSSESEPLPPLAATFVRRLAADGFVVTDRTLRRELPIDMGVPEAESELVRLLNRHGFAVAKGHLEQAFDNHADGNWASANSQVRAFLEGLLDEIAIKIDPATASGTSENRRAGLAKAGFLSADLNEWGNEGKNFINGLMKRLHPKGAHPGLSDEDDSTFRLHVVLLTARLLLSRFDARVTP